MLNLISPRDNEQIIENGDFIQSCCLSWWNPISRTHFCLPPLAKVSLFTSWVMMYVNRHLVYRKSTWAPFSLLSSPTGCKRSEVNQQQEFLLPAQDALDYACISTRDFNFLYTELRLDSLKGHSLCDRVCSAVCFIYWKQPLAWEQGCFPCYCLLSS